MSSLNWTENDTTEFKESLSQSQVEEGIQTLVGFANHSAGKVYFGVKNNGDVLGLTISEKTLRDIATQIQQTTDPTLTAEVREETIDSKKVLVASIGKSLHAPHTYKGIPYIRSGSATLRMSQSQYETLLRQRPAFHDFTSQIILETSINDLDSEALRRFRSLLSLRENHFGNLTDEQILSDLLLLRNGQLTYAALILLGSSVSLAKYLPQAEVRYLRYTNDYDIQYSYTNRSTSSQLPLVIQLDTLLPEIQVEISNVQFGLFRLEVKNFQTEVLQEAILNAIMHREYTVQSHIFIKQYPSHIEITSPGGFIGGITPTNILYHAPVYRNPLLASVLSRIFAVQQAGQGIDIMYKDLIERGLFLNYREWESNVRLDIPAGIGDPEFYALTTSIGEAGIPLSLLHLFILRFLKDEKGATRRAVEHYLVTRFGFPTSTFQGAFQFLLDNHLVEGFGERGGRKFFLAERFLRQFGELGDTTRAVGPSAKAIEEIIKDHLNRYHEGNLRDFINALGISAQDQRLVRRVQNVLASLLSQGIIENDSKGRWTNYWLKTK